MASVFQSHIVIHSGTVIIVQVWYGRTSATNKIDTIKNGVYDRSCLDTWNTDLNQQIFILLA